LILVALAACTGNATAQAAPLRTLVVLLTGGPEPLTRAEMRSLVFDDVSGFLSTASFGTTSLVGEVTPWIRPPFNPDCAQAPLRAGDGREAARAAGYDPSGYERVIYLIPTSVGCRLGYASRADPGVQEIAIFGWLRTEPILHELGHTFGMEHAGLWNGCSGNPLSVAYQLCVMEGDPYDPMSNNENVGDYNAFEKFAAGWLANVTRVDTNGEYTIDLLEQQSSLPQALVVETARNSYWFDHREPVANDARLAGSSLLDGLMVHVGSNPHEPIERSSYYSPVFARMKSVLNLLYRNPTGSGSDAVRPGETFSERGAFSLTVLSHVGTSVTARFAWTDQTRPKAPRITIRIRGRAASVAWAKAAEAGSGVAQYDIRLDGRARPPVSAAGPRAVRFPSLGRGRHRVSITAIDRAGNRGTPATRAFRIR